MTSKESVERRGGVVWRWWWWLLLLWLLWVRWISPDVDLSDDVWLVKDVRVEAALFVVALDENEGGVEVEVEEVDVEVEEVERGGRYLRIGVPGPAGPRL